MKIKPLTCPFCGRIPKFTHITASLAAPELDNAFWSLSCSDKSNCTVYPAAYGDTRPKAVRAWNQRVERDIFQRPLKPDDKPPFMARCGNVLVMVKNIECDGGVGPFFLKGLILEGVHINDRGDYGPGDTVTFGPLSEYWRRITLTQKP